MLRVPPKDPTGRTLDVVVLGPLNIDLIVRGAAPRDFDQLTQWVALSDVQLNVAGAAGYPAQVFQKLGLRTGVLANIAEDLFGTHIRGELAAQGIDVSRLQSMSAAQTSIAIYMLLFGSKKRPLTGRPIQYQPWPSPLQEVEYNYALSARLLHIAGYLHYPAMWTEDIPSLLQEVRARGNLVSLDPQFPLFPVEGLWLRGIEKLLPFTNILLISQDEIQNITGLADLSVSAHMLLGMGPEILVIKRGNQGSMIFTQQEQIAQPALEISESMIVDTVGAGDAFDAGFLSALLEGCDIVEAAAFATEVATHSLQGHGAVMAVPEKLTNRLSQKRIT